MVKKLFSLTIVLISTFSMLLLLDQPIAEGAADTEEITLTTYYPAPHGDYNTLTTNQLVVGSGTPAATDQVGVVGFTPRPEPNIGQLGDLYFNDGSGGELEGLHFRDSTGWNLIGDSDGLEVKRIGVGLARIANLGVSISGVVPYNLGDDWKLVMLTGYVHGYIYKDPMDSDKKKVILSTWGSAVAGAAVDYYFVNKQYVYCAEIPSPALDASNRISDVNDLVGISGTDPTGTTTCAVGLNAAGDLLVWVLHDAVATVVTSYVQLS